MNERGKRARRRRKAAVMEGKTMAKQLVRSCSACGNDVSCRSPFCRHCGHPQAAPLVVWLLALFLLVLLALYVAFTIYCMCNVQELRVNAGYVVQDASPAHVAHGPVAGDGQPSPRTGLLPESRD